MKSIWSIFTNAKKEAGAKGILKRTLQNMETEVHGVQISSYHKSGFKIGFSVEHIEKEWNDIVIECIALGQLIGYGWQLHGDILHDPSAVTNKTNVSGVEMIEWQIIK